MVEATAKDVEEMLNWCYATHKPIALVSDPGMGKTSLINAWAKKHGYGDPIVLLGAQIEPQDIAGLPMQSKIEVGGRTITTTEYGAPYWQVELMRGERKILFMDEFSNSPASVQSALLKLVGDRVFANGEKVPEDVLIILAMNPENSAADYNIIPAPMANRITFVSYRPSNKEVYKGLNGGWYSDEITDKWSSAEKQWRSSVVNFLRESNGTYISMMNDVIDNDNEESAVSAYLDPDSIKSASEREILTLAWPSPRSWENLACILAQSGYDGNVTPLQQRIMNGTVGHKAALHFCEYLETHSQVDAFSVIKDPSIFDWKNNTNTYNETVTLAKNICEKVPECNGKNGKPTIEQALEFFDKVIDLGGGAYFMNDFCQSKTGSGHYFKANCPDGTELCKWKEKINSILIKFRKSDLIPDGNKKEI